jgi:hypothetical protein
MVTIITLIFILIIFLLKKRMVFKILSRINRYIFPSMYKKDIKKLKKWEMLIVAYRYWVTKNAI